MVFCTGLLSSPASAQLFDNLDPFENGCGPNHPLTNECQRQRIAAMRDINMQRAATLPRPLPPRTSKMPIKCYPGKSTYSECESARQRYQQVLVDLVDAEARRKQLRRANAQQIVADQNRQTQQQIQRQQLQQDVRDAVRDGFRR